MGCKDIGNRKYEFVAKIQILWEDTEPLQLFNILLKYKINKAKHLTLNANKKDAYKI